MRTTMENVNRERVVTVKNGWVLLPLNILLLLAGPALSLPSMLVLRSIMGTKKVVVYVALVIVMATLTGLVYGAWF